ncbi:MAG: radical SAM protein [Flavobacteriales bacterium]|nr:MAG: radical SAM protein [Flavobacteriales bacterium]
MKEGIGFLSKLTFRKALNSTKVLSSFYLSKLLRQPIVWGVPMSISIEPTTSCNLRCPECPSGLRSFTRPTGMLEPDTFHKVIDELSASLSYLLFYFQGEPYLHPQFTDLVKYASDKGVYTATSTNAHFLNDENSRSTIESGLDRLIISIDGTTQESYESYRIGGELEKVIRGTRNIIKWKKKLKSSTPHVIFQFLVVKPNEHQIEEVEKLGKELGVDEVRLKTAQIYDFKKGSPLIPTIDKYSRYAKGKNGDYTLKNSLSDECWKLWHSSVITWDGRVVPCCFDKDASHQMGSLANESFRSLWTNKNYMNFRRAILNSRSSIDICKNCTEGTKVWT